MSQISVQSTQSGASVLRGGENSDIFFQHREACNKYYNDGCATVMYMDKVNEKSAQIISRSTTTVHPMPTELSLYGLCLRYNQRKQLNMYPRRKTGMVCVHLYRPFSAEYLISAIPEAVKTISVIDRTKSRAHSASRYLDVVAALKGSSSTALKFTAVATVCQGYSSCSHYFGIANECRRAKENIALSIEDDVTNLSLDVTESPDTTPKGTTSCKFWGLGSDGTVGANKDSIKIIGDNTDMYAQGYFFYDSKKSGGITVSHLRFGSSPITSTYLINKANFVACHNPSYVTKYDMVQDIVPGGTFLLNCIWSPEELDKQLPAKMKRYIAENNINFYTINGIKLLRRLVFRAVHQQFFNLHFSPSAVFSC
ncbi:MAG: 2-oxoacid:acceptor oxidoreductase family protein [Eubacterium sp.]